MIKATVVSISTCMLVHTYSMEAKASFHTRKALIAMASIYEDTYCLQQPQSRMLVILMH